MQDPSVKHNIGTYRHFIGGAMKIILSNKFYSLMTLCVSVILFLSFLQPTVYANNLSEKSSLSKATPSGIGPQNRLQDIPLITAEEPRRKIAFITGITRGIGRSVAELFLQNGIHVIGVASDATALQAFYTKIFLTILPLVGEVILK